MLDAIEVFVAAVETGSLTAAARKLGVTPSAVSRRIAALEGELKVPLLARTTRALRPTDDGLAFHRRCARILEELDEARRDLTSRGTTPRGLLRVEVPVALGRFLLVPKLEVFLARYPEIDVELSFRDTYSDPVSEGIDVLVRIAPLFDSALMVRKLAESRIVVCASPSYLTSRGTPRTPVDLRSHDCIGFLRDGRPDPWRFASRSAPEGALSSIDIRGRLHTNEVDALLAGALAGRGLIAVFDFLVEGALRRGELVEVLRDDALVTRPIHALYPKHRHRVPKVEAFLDFLSEEVFPRSAPAGSGKSRGRRPGTSRRSKSR